MRSMLLRVHHFAAFCAHNETQILLAEQLQIFVLLLVTQVNGALSSALEGREAAQHEAALAKEALEAEQLSR